MDIDALINEKIQRLQDLNKQMTEIARKIGVLQEEGKALHGSALQFKGAIESLAELKAKDDAEKAAAAKSLILPDKTLVAADGKTVIVEAAPEAPVAPVAEVPTADPAQHGEPQAEKAPIALEVK